MYDQMHKTPKEGSDRVIGSSNASGKDRHHAHMGSKDNHPGDRNASYKYGAAGKIGLYLKSKGSAGSAY